MEISQIITHSLVLWLLPLSFVLHDLEEMITWNGWMQKNHRLLDVIKSKNKFTRYLISHISPKAIQMAWAALFELFIIVFFTLWAQVLPTVFYGIQLYTIILLSLLFHVFSHIGQLIIFRKYTPGVITAVLIVLPNMLYILSRIFLIFHYSISTLLLLSLVGILIFLPVVLTAHKAGQWLNNKFGNLNPHSKYH